MSNGYDKGLGRYVVKPTPTKENPKSAWIAEGSHRATSLRRLWQSVKDGERKEEDLLAKNIPKKIEALTTKLDANDSDIISWCERMYILINCFYFY